MFDDTFFIVSYETYQYIGRSNILDIVRDNTIESAFLQICLYCVGTAKWISKNNDLAMKRCVSNDSV